MSSDRPACHRRIKSKAFEAPNTLQLGRLEPCGFCFPDGDVDVAEAKLLVSSDRANAIHRHEDTGELAPPTTNDGGTTLRRALEDADTIAEALADSGEPEGGDA